MIEDPATRASRALLIRQAALASQRAFERQLGAIEITAPQAFVLLAIAARDDANLISLVTDTGIDRSTMSDIVRRLVKQGWLRRRRSRDDARAVLVHLTAVGEQALPEIREALRQSEATVLAAIPADQRALFWAVLERLCASEAVIAHAFRRLVG
jgi:DNA-binding MarR family transcriptional regulator